MITNLSSFIKPVDQPTNSLKGVVTPYDQKFNKKEEDGFSLFEIIRNEKLRDRFGRDVFPEFQVMDNGEIFMAPTKRIIQTLHEYYVKWFILDEKFNISHDHDYPYANVPRNGYLMKIVIPKLSEYPDDFSIEYVCNINHIQTQIIDNIHTIQSQGNIDVNIHEDLTIEGFDPVRYPQIHELLLNKKDFFNKYLNYIFE